MNTLTKREKLIYLASLIEGEGSIAIEIQSQSIRHKRKIDYYSLRLIITNTYLKLLEWVKENFGGKILTRKKIVGRKQCYTWSICSHNAADILKECRDFMFSKQPRADIFIEFASTMSRTHHRISDELLLKRKELYLKMKILNKSGD